ncbi:NADPH-dependent FMN reductase [Mycotypha africana]|uniref:NADPH-dependent FMN reductase n=1 Tax=Mycotypha africana TaxID=64632 RepID=UPI0023013485|nr:NADPH-dependent FMN reductase [Mycotypha africana]KAI8984086.1 NADPH-dependent FMN reductase [Mycotypha africana]
MNVGVIIGSTRPNRIADQIAQLLMQTIDKAKHPTLNFEVIDLANWNLPLCNEPVIPALAEQRYTYELTRQWSAKINSKQAFIFITPEYNWGYPASLKNALDYLCKEWHDKPAMIVSYAYTGGEKAAAQLSQVLQGLRMGVVDTMPAIYLSHDMFIESTNKIKETYADTFVKEYAKVIDRAVIELARGLQQQKSLH